MSISRYDNRLLLTNKSKSFQEHFDKRNVSFIRHFSTMKINPDASEKMAGLSLEYHIWQLGDRLHKIAEQHYGDGRLWYIIALFNTAPTDAHISIGQTIMIPKPLQKVLGIFGI